VNDYEDLLNLFKKGWDMCCRYDIRIRIKCFMSRICHKKKRSSKWHVAKCKQVVKESMSMRHQYSYYEFIFYITFVFAKRFDIPCTFGCLNSGEI
jgi:hypothetical protein